MKIDRSYHFFSLIKFACILIFKGDVDCIFFFYIKMVSEVGLIVFSRILLNHTSYSIYLSSIKMFDSESVLGEQRKARS